MSRETFATGMNDRAQEHARLARVAREKRKIADEYPGDGYEVEAVLAEEALRKFEERTDTMEVEK